LKDFAGIAFTKQFEAGELNAAGSRHLPSGGGGAGQWAARKARWTV